VPNFTSIGAMLMLLNQVKKLWIK